MNKKTGLKVGSAVLAAVMSFTMVPFVKGGEEVRADALIKHHQNTKFGFRGISDPVMGTTSAWSGCYVYFGSYSYGSVKSYPKYRVLDHSSNIFSDTPTLFIESDRILFDFVENDDNYNWSTSSIRNELNGNFLSKNFSQLERDAIAKSSIKTHSYNETWEFSDWAADVYGPYKNISDLNYTPLNNDKVFLLDLEDVHTRKYGYYNKAGAFDNRLKKRRLGGNTWSDSTGWAVRNWFKQDFKDGDYEYTKYRPAVLNGGSFDNYLNDTFFVAPAMNIRSDRVAFNTLVSGQYGQPGSEYKLTLRDEQMSVDIQSGKNYTFVDGEIIVPYEITNKSTVSKYNQLSILIVDSTTHDIVRYNRMDMQDGSDPTDIPQKGVATYYVPYDMIDDVVSGNYSVRIFPEYQTGNIYDYDTAGRYTYLYLSQNEQIGQVKKTTVTRDASANTLNLSWSKVENADDYEVWQRIERKNSLSNWTLMTTTTSVSAVFDDPVDPEDTGTGRRVRDRVIGVRYKVRAHINRNGSDYYGEFGNIAVPMDPVTGVTATRSEGGDKVTVRWNAYDGALDYDIYQQTLGGHSRRENEKLVKVANSTSTVVGVDLENPERDCYFFVVAHKVVEDEDCYTPNSDAAFAWYAQKDVTIELTAGENKITKEQLDAIYYLWEQKLINNIGESDYEFYEFYDIDQDGTKDVGLMRKDDKPLWLMSGYSVHGSKEFDCSKIYKSLYSKITFKFPEPTATPTTKPTATPTSKPKATATPTGAAKVTATPTPKAGSKPTATPTAVAKPTSKVTTAPTTAPSGDPKAQILAFVERIYTYVLDREPEEEGAKFWSDELYSFRRTGAEVGLGFIFSDEFVNRGLSDEEFVTVLYKTFFGREPEEGGFKFWTGALKDGSMDRRAVANGFIFSQEWADTCASYGIRSGGEIAPSVSIEPTDATYAFVERMYTTAMKRASDEEGKIFWSKELANFRFTGEQVGVMFFLSEEMQGFGLDNKEFVTRLYKTFMDRDPEEGGFNFWVGYLADGGSREGAVLGFTRSEEFVNKCVEARILPY